MDSNGVMPPLCSPERAERLGRVNRALWAELRQSAESLCATLNADPEFGSWRARVRMLRAILGELDVEFEHFVACRTTLAERIEDESFRVIGTIDETLKHLLERIEDDRADVREVVIAFFGEGMDEGVGVGFLRALDRFEAAFSDWQTAWPLLDNLDGQEVGDLAVEHAKLDCRIDGLEAAWRARAVQP